MHLPMVIQVLSRLLILKTNKLDYTRFSFLFLSISDLVLMMSILEFSINSMVSYTDITLESTFETKLIPGHDVIGSAFS